MKLFNSMIPVGWEARTESTEDFKLMENNTRNQFQGFVRQVAILGNIQQCQEWKIFDILHTSISQASTTNFQGPQILKICMN